MSVQLGGNQSPPADLGLLLEGLHKAEGAGAFLDHEANTLLLSEGSEFLRPFFEARGPALGVVAQARRLAVARGLPATSLDGSIEHLLRGGEVEARPAGRTRVTIKANDLGGRE